MFDEQKPQDEIAGDLLALERQLRGLSPTAPRIDRDRLMFAAGKAAVAQESGRDGRAMDIAGPSWAGRRFWPAATATMTAATLLLTTMLVWQKQRSQTVVGQSAEPQSVVKAVNRSGDVDADLPDRFASGGMRFIPPSATSGYLGVRYVALTSGLGAGPNDVPVAGSNRDLPGDSLQTEPATTRDLLEELLPSIHRKVLQRSKI